MYLISLTELSGSKKIEQNIAPGSGIDLEYETDGKTLWKYFFLSVKLVFMNSIQLIWLFGYDKHVAQHWLVHVFLISCQYLDRCDLVTCLQQCLMYWGSRRHIFGHLISCNFSTVNISWGSPVWDLLCHSPQRPMPGGGIPLLRETHCHRVRGCLHQGMIDTVAEDLQAIYTIMDQGRLEVWMVGSWLSFVNSFFSVLKDKLEEL